MADRDENKGGNLKLERDEAGRAWLHFDVKGSPVNVFSSAVLDEFDAILAGLEKDPPKGLLIVSDKKSGFIAGANIEEFTTFKGRDEALAFIRKGHAVFSRLEALPFPTAALIHGFCLGGGLEMALACDYRIATDDPKTKLGLPEVKLGIHPGFGGAVRLIETCGVITAMPLMLTGRALDAHRARRAGFVDAAVPLRQLKRAGVFYIDHKPKKKKPGRLARLANTAPARNLLARKFEKEVAKKARREHYPAPYALIETWREHGGDRAAFLKAEGESVADLATTETARNLVRLFFLQEKLKGLGKGAKGPKVAHLHVIGAGTMGGDIAAFAAYRGLRVTLQDREPKFIAPAIKRANKLFAKRLRRPKWRRQAAADRLIPDPKGYAVEKADLVIEAIIENEDIKKELFQSLEPRLKKGAMLATNTSSIRLEKLAGALDDKSHLLGLHFFNPVAQMMLVEVVKGEHTPDEAVADGCAFVANQLGKLPLPVKSAPGFLVNRCLLPYMQEAMLMIEEGIAPETIDAAATDFGMPMGPILLADTVGLDVALYVSKVLAADLGGTVPQRLEAMVDAGHLGKKSGKGFYEYRKGKPVRDKSAPPPDPDLARRMIARMVNEGMAVLREGVVDDAELLDAGMVFGAGFAPFRGGPLHWVATRGKDDFLAELKRLEEKYGERFAPDPGWESWQPPAS